MMRLLFSFSVLVLFCTSVQAADFGIGVRPLDNTLLFPIRFKSRYLLELSFSYSKLMSLESSSENNHIIYSDDANKTSYGLGFFWMQNERYNFQPYYGARFSYITGERQKEYDSKFTNKSDFKISTTGASISPIVVGFAYNINQKFSFGIESGLRILGSGNSESNGSAGSIANGTFSDKERYFSSRTTIKTFTNLVVRFLF